MRRALAWVLALVSAVGMGLLAPVGAQGIAVASTAAPYCGISWGSLNKSANPNLGAGPVTSIRAGRHDCFDRLVFDIDGPAATFKAGYVGAVYEDGSGDLVPLRGGAFLQIVVIADSYRSYVPKNRTDVVNVAGWQTFRQVAFAGNYESHYSFGLGVRARLPFRVFTLDGPSGITSCCRRRAPLVAGLSDDQAAAELALRIQFVVNGIDRAGTAEPSGL